MKSKIVKIHDLYCFQVDDKVIDSLAFKSFRPTKKNVTDFYKAGVRIFHVYCSGLPSGLKVPYSLFGETWFDSYKYDWTNLDKQIELFKSCAPDGYVFVNIHMDTRQWFIDKYNCPNSFTHLSQVAALKEYREQTAAYIKALIKHTEEKYNDFVLGYFLLGGFTTEWFSEKDYEASHPIKLKAYREYMHDNNVDIPTQEILERPKEEILLKQNQDVVIPYREFHNKLIAELVLYFCHQAQEELHHNKILGLFFGYILELINERMWNAGHIEFDLINHSKDIDLIATPSSYQFRNFDSTGAYMLLCDSLELNEKACFISFDHTTYLVPSLPTNNTRECDDPGTAEALAILAEMRSRNKKDLLIDKHQTIQAMRREFMQRYAKRVGLWWFDMLEGWFYDPDLMNEVKHEVELYKRYMNVDKTSISEVAVFFSGQSLYYINKMSEINTETICNQREGLNRMGAPYDAYSLNDIDKVNLSKYKLLIFVEALKLTDYQRNLINKLKDTKTMLFVGPIDYANNGIKSTNSILNMNLYPLDNEEQTIVSNNNEFGYYNLKKDNFTTDDKDVEVLGNYKISTKPGLIRKGNVIFSGIGNLSYQVLQTILDIAGVHKYITNGEGTYINKNFIGIHSPNYKSTTISLLEDGQYEELFSGKIYTSVNKEITLDTSFECDQMLHKVS